MAVDLKLLVEQCRQETESDADRSRARENTEEADARRSDARGGDGRVVKRQERLGEHQGSRVVEDGLAEDHREDVLLDAQLVERGEDSDGVGCRDERPEGERGK